MDNTGFAKEFSRESAKRGSPKSLADAIGMPDAVDKEFIEKLLIRYDKKHPGVIKAVRDEARAQHQAQGGRIAEWSEVNKAAHGRVMLELPAELAHQLELHYPTMFINKKHFRWFIRNFKHLAVPTKI